MTISLYSQLKGCNSITYFMRVAKNSCVTFLVCLASYNFTSAQNAFMFFSDTTMHDPRDKAGSFLIDTSISGTGRAILLWGRISNPDSTTLLSLDELNANGGFISRHIVPVADYVGSIQKIIKSRFFNGYYLLANSGHLNIEAPGYLDYTPVIIKIDQNLNPIWVRKIYDFSSYPGHLSSFIIYSDFIEAKNGDLILLGNQPATDLDFHDMLITRMSSDGIVIWNYLYLRSDTSQHILGNSLVESTNGNICVTGSTGFRPWVGTLDNVLFFVTDGFGSPIRMKYLNAPTGIVEGYKIVRYGEETSNNKFLICGTYLNTGYPLDNQILVTDINENGIIAGSWQIGEARDPRDPADFEESSDVIFRKNDDGTFTFHLTGTTSSYYSSGAYYLQLKYSYGAMSLEEFSTLMAGSVTGYYGVPEIKSAGSGKFAILMNSRHGPSRVAGLAIRDLNDPLNNCFLRRHPPLGTVSLNSKNFKVRRISRELAIEDEKFIEVTPGYSTPRCGEFLVDPYNANTAGGNPDLIVGTKRENKNTTIDAQMATDNSIRIFPNPVSNVVSIQSNEPIVSAFIVNVSGKAVKAATNIHTLKLDLSAHELTGGTYFIKVVRKGGVSIHKVICSR